MKRPGASSSSSTTIHIFIITIAVALLLSACPAHGQISNSSLNVTQIQLECLNAVSYDLCSNDASYTCPTRFYLDQFVEPLYRQQLFTYLVDRYIFETNASASWLLSQLLGASDTYSNSVDSTYGTQCSTDPDIQTLVSGTSPAQADIGRNWWLLLMKQAEFCTENQIFLQGMGCVCKEDKNCDETNTHQYTEVMRTMIFIVIVALVVTLSSIYVFTRHGQGLHKEYLAIINAAGKVVHILQNAISENWRLRKGAELNSGPGQQQHHHQSSLVQTQMTAPHHSTNLYSHAPSGGGTPMALKPRRKPPAANSSPPVVPQSTTNNTLVKIASSISAGPPTPKAPPPTSVNPVVQHHHLPASSQPSSSSSPTTPLLHRVESESEFEK